MLLSATIVLVLLGACGDDPAPAPAPTAPTADTAPTAPTADTAPTAPTADAAPPPEPVGDLGDAGPVPTASPLPPGKPMLLDFTRDHCLPCVLMEPWIAAIREKHAARVGVLEINIDRPPNKPLGLFFKVKSIPTQVYVDARGREVHRNVGLARQPEMEKLLEKLGFLKEPPAK
jgi:thiol-disulfide isomerase/thioredoxin